MKSENVTPPIAIIVQLECEELIQPEFPEIAADRGFYSVTIEMEKKLRFTAKSENCKFLQIPSSYFKDFL